MKNEENFFKKRNPNNDSGKTIFTWIISSILISAAVIGFTFMTTGKKQPLTVPQIKKKSNVLSFLKGRQNILLLGVDSNGKGSDAFKGTRSDSIIVINIDPSDKTINAISIPRDSKIYISNGHGINKINSAHALGGAKLAAKTIEETFGIKIDHYMVINYEGVRAFIDTIGGVPVNVEKRMRYTDKTAGLYIDLRQGQQVLNAEKAEQYLRFRHDAVGDIGRIQRQQWFIKGIAERFKSPEIFTRIPTIVEILKDYVQTDMNVFELSKYAASLKGFKPENTQAATMPGSPSLSGDLSYWIIDPEKAQDTIDKLIYRQETGNQKNEEITVSLLYTRNTSYRVAEITSYLKGMGYDVNCTDIIVDPHSQIIVHEKRIAEKIVNNLRKGIPELNEAQHIYSPKAYMCGKSDLSIILGD